MKLIVSTPSLIKQASIILMTILLAGFICPSNGLAQRPYMPLAVDGPRWGIGIRPPGTIGPYEELYEFFIEGDTLFNGKRYKKLYQWEIEAVSSAWSPPFKPINRNG